MLRRLVRTVFSLNAVYQIGVGAVALIAPAFLIAVYGGDASHAADLYLRALYRGLGAYMLFSGLVSALVAYDPEGSPLLLLAQGALSALTLACWGVALAAGDVQWSQVSTDVLIQLPLLAAIALYYPRARQYVADKLLILMDGRWKAPAAPAAYATPADDVEPEAKRLVEQLTAELQPKTPAEAERIRRA